MFISSYRASPANQPLLSLLGPNSITVNTTTSNFSVQLVNPKGGNVTVTPVVTGITGSFSPSSFVLSPSVTSATFTFTPTNTGTGSISITNSRGFGTIGSPMPFTSIGVFATSFALSGPTAGNTNVASTFTITPNAIMGSTIVVTPSATNGALVSPATLTFSAGSSASQSFTVMRTTDGTSSVSASSSLPVTGTPITYTSTTASSSFSVPDQTFTAGVPNQQKDLSVYVPNWNPSTMNLILQGSWTTPPFTFDGTTGILTYDGSTGAVTLSGLSLQIVMLTDQPTYIAVLSPFQIKRLTQSTNGNTTLKSVITSDWINADGTDATHGGAGSLKNMTSAWSTAAADGEAGMMWNHGGGHSDWIGNHLIQTDFKGDSMPAGITSVDYSPLANVVLGADPTSDGKPVSSHTYDGMCYDPKLRRIHRYGGSAGGSGGMPRRNWIYDRDTSSWIAAPQTPNAILVNQHAAIIDVEQRKTLIVAHDGNAWFHQLDANTTTGIVRSWPGSNGTGDMTSAYDTLRSRAIVYTDGAPQLQLITPNWAAETFTTSTITPTGDTSAIGTRGHCWIYDPYRDVYWLLPLGDRITNFPTIYEMQAVSPWLITAHTTSGDNGVTPSFSYIPSDPTCAGLFKKVCPMLQWRAIGFITDMNMEPFVIKLPPATP